MLTQKEYAKQKGWSPQYITNLLKQGKITLDNGKIDPKKADADLARNKEKVSESATPIVKTTAEPLGVSYIQARTVTETYKAKKQKLEYERLTGKLLDSDRVLQVTDQAFSNVRVRLRGLAKSLAPILAANNRPAEVEKMLRDAIDNALESLSGDIFKA